MKKSIAVFTNDPANGRISLTIGGEVLRFAKLEPKYARLIGETGTEIKQTITITREEAYPFSIVEAKAKNGKKISIDVQEFKKENSDGYTVTISNKMAQPGRYSDTLVLTTDSKVKPILTIPVYGRIISEELWQTKPKAEQPSTNEG